MEIVPGPGLIYGLGNIFNYLAVPGLFLFIGFYLIRSPWREYEAGRVLMWFALALGASVAAGVLVALFGNEYWGREWVRLIVQAFVFFTIWRMFITLRRIQLRPPLTEDQLRVALANMLISDRHHPYKPHPEEPKEIEMSNTNDGAPVADAVLVAGPTPVLVPSKYQAAILGTALTLLFAFQTALTGGFSAVEGWNFAALAAGVIVSYWARLLASKWSSVLKVAGAVAAAVAIAIVSVIDVQNGGPGWNAETTVAVVFAGLNALAAAVGVHKRVDEAKAALLDPGVDNAAVQSADKGATKAAAYALAS